MNASQPARDRAVAAVVPLRSRVPSVLAVDGIGLDGALEQQIFFAFRVRRLPAGDVAALAWQLANGARTLAAIGAAIVPRRVHADTDGCVAVLVRERIHLEAVERIAAHLRLLGGPPVVAVLIGRVGGVVVRAASHRELRLAPLLAPRRMGRVPGLQLQLLANQARVRGALRAGGAPADVLAGSTLLLDKSRRSMAGSAEAIAGHESEPCPLDHPLVGRLHCGEWLLFAGVHDLMHLEQLDALRIRGTGEPDAGAGA